MAGTRAGVSGYEDLKAQRHRIRNILEEVEHLVAMGESLDIALRRLGVNKDAYEKMVVRSR